MSYHLHFRLPFLPDLTLTKYNVLDGSGVKHVIEKHDAFLRQLHRLGCELSASIHLLIEYDPDEPLGDRLKVGLYVKAETSDQLEYVQETIAASALAPYFPFECIDTVDALSFEDGDAILHTLTGHAYPFVAEDAKAIADEIESLKKNRVRFRVLGDFSRLDPALVEAIRSAEEFTDPGPGEEPALDLIVFLSYSGKWDILQAARRIVREYSASPEAIDSLDDAAFSSRLVTSGIPDPDLIIRTSGESRLSNYLLWQAAYSEFLFVDTLWPDFGKKEFFSALEEFSKRDRRYGKVK